MKEKEVGSKTWFLFSISFFLPFPCSSFPTPPEPEQGGERDWAEVGEHSLYRVQVSGGRREWSKELGPQHCE